MKRSLVEYREAVATELAVQGHTYEHIAAVLGYRSRSGAWRAVRRALARRRDQVATEYLWRRLDGLDAVEGHLRGAALRGDVDASMRLLNVIDRRSDLLGL